MYVESENGHDTLQVQENNVQSEVEQQLNNDKWVTTEKANGSTEILTKNDIPNENKPKDDWKTCFSSGKETSTSQSHKITNNSTTSSETNSTSNKQINSVTKSATKKAWAKKFECVKSITSVNKAKGG